MANFKFPRCDAEVGGGKTKMITKMSIKVDNSATFEATFGGGGMSYGPVKCDGSFDLKIASNMPANAPERNWLRMVFNKEDAQAVFKLPTGDRIAFQGAFSSMDINSAVEGAVEGSVSFVGTGRLIPAS